MIRYFLAKVRIEGFRGINNESEPLELSFASDAANSVFAINGTGKSSVFDALCYAISGRIPKLDKLQASEKPDEYYGNKFHGSGEATIELTLESDEPTPSQVSIKVQRKADGTRHTSSPSGYAEPEELLTSLNESFTLLDYQSFTKFIDHTPLERGRSFSSLLGLAVYSDFRQTLKTAIDLRAVNADLELSTLQTEVTRYEDATGIALGKLEVAFSALTGNSIKDTTKLETYSTEVVTALASIELIKSACSGKKLAELDFVAIKNMVKTAEGGKDRERLAGLIATITKLEAVGLPDESEMTTKQAGLNKEFSEVVELYKKTRGDLCKSLYSAAELVLADGQWKNDHECPLCISKLDKPIADIVKEQQEQYAQVDAKIVEIQSSWKTNSWRSRIARLESAIGSDLSETERLFQPFDQKVNEGKVVVTELNSIITYYGKLEARLAKALETYKAQKDTLEKKLPPSLVQLTEQVEFARQYREALKDYKTSVAKFKVVNDKLKLRKRWQTFIVGAADEFAKAEAQLSKNKIAAIENEYKAMFASVMGVNDITPDLKRDDSREDLQVQLSDFHGINNVSARALLSESYRNALAISIYLTAAINHKGAPRFIVLDDITSSFDSGHQLNLMEYIRNNLRYPKNAKGLQFIILSHDGIMQKYFDGLQKKDGWKHQALEGMPPGVITTRDQDANRVRAIAMRHLSAGQVDIGQPWVRQYLECILMQVIRKTNIPVPLDFAIKDHTRVVSNCLDVINRAVDLQIKAGDMALDATQIAGLNSTYVPALLGNWVSHYETGSGASVAPAVLIGVLQTVDDFADCFKHDFADATGNIERRWYKKLSTA